MSWWEEWRFKLKVTLVESRDKLLAMTSRTRQGICKQLESTMCKEPLHINIISAHINKTLASQYGNTLSKQIISEQ